jgi:hypothetical protein
VLYLRAVVGVLDDLVGLGETRLDVAPALLEEMDDVRALEAGLPLENVRSPAGE